MNNSNTHNRESNMHYYAKLIFSQWLQRKWESARNNKITTAKLGVIEWNVDCRYGPAIYIEYPLLKTDNDVLGLIDWKEKYPDLSETNLKNLGLTLEAVLDIAICENGRLKYGIEIVYKHLCSQKKRQFFAKNCPNIMVYEISAEWILSQIYGKLPTIVPLTAI